MNLLRFGTIYAWPAGLVLRRVPDAPQSEQHDVYINTSYTPVNPLIINDAHVARDHESGRVPFTKLDNFTVADPHEIRCEVLPTKPTPLQVSEDDPVQVFLKSLQELVPTIANDQIGTLRETLQTLFLAIQAGTAQFFVNRSTHDLIIVEDLDALKRSDKLTV